MVPMKATIETTEGPITVELYPNDAPATVANFTGLATGEKEWKDPETGQPSHEPFYDGLVFHRVIDGFMIQGGCPQGTGTGGPGYNFDDEIHPSLRFDQPYLLAMANAGKRAQPHHGAARRHQRLAVLHHRWPHSDLTGAHTIFGKVADDASRAVVDKIATTPVWSAMTSPRGRHDHGRHHHRGLGFACPTPPHLPFARATQTGFRM